MCIYIYTYICIHIYMTCVHTDIYYDALRIARAGVLESGTRKRACGPFP